MTPDPLHTIIAQTLADAAKLVCVLGIVACIMVIAVGFAP